MYPESIKNLIEAFKYLPGIGEKTAERLAFSILELDDDQVEFFSDSLKDFCSDVSRNNKILCVLEDPKNVFLFEKAGFFSGKYHILNGLISPLDGINPEDIGIDKLLDRIEKDKFEEIIFAFKPSIEGETTALYIKKILSGLNVKVTRLASGVPMGADMEYVDSLTLERALNDRKEIN